jgi:hypothetical protein
MDNREIQGSCPRVVWDGSELDWVPPRKERIYLRGVGWKYLAEWPFDEAHRRLLESYKPGRKYRLGLFIPCAYGKPYSQSYIHYLIRRAIKDYIKSGVLHEIILTNAGVVPRELDEYWPYTAYDWNPLKETPEIRECYKNVLKNRILDYLTKNKDYYMMFAAYLRWDSDSWAALREVAEELDMDIPNLAAKTVPRIELEEASLGLGYIEDPDLILVTPTSLSGLTDWLRTRLG